MYKKKSIFSIVLMFVLSLFVFSACSIQKDINVKSIEVVEETIPEFIVVGGFDDANIQALVKYDDNSEETIKITTDLLGNYARYVEEVGTYEIEILFRGATCKFTIKVVDSTQVHMVSFYNGNNELISMSMVESGKDAIAPKMEFVNMNGYVFMGWDRSFTNVTENINVYAIYTKVDSMGIDTNNLEQVLLKSAENMRNNNYLNINQINEMTNLKTITTVYYDDTNIINSIVSKKIYESTVEYYKYFISNGVYQYQLYNANGETYPNEITFDEFNQFNLYNNIKSLISNNENNIQYKVHLSTSENYYSVSIFTEPTNLDFDSVEYEYIFTESKILYLNKFGVNKSEDSKTKISSECYIIPQSDELVIYPSNINLAEILDSFYKNDFVMIVANYDGDTHTSELYKNDGDNDAVMCLSNDNETYCWIDNEVRYCTYESITSSNVPKVYKQTSSTSYYDKQPYYLWKNYSDNLELSCVRDDGSVVFEITIPESSSSPLTIHQFVINIGKLIEIRYFVGETMMGDSYVNYQNVVIEVPEILTNRQSDAIES